MIDLRSPITELKGVGDKKAKKLSKIGISTVMDLLSHFPARYEDRTYIKKLFEIANDERVGSFGEIVNIQKTMPRRNMKVIKIAVKQGDDIAFLIVFNNEYILNKFGIGDKISFYGKAKRSFGKLEFQSPEIEKYGENNSIGIIYPIYPLTLGITNNEIRKLIQYVIDKVDLSELDILSKKILSHINIAPMDFTIRNLHFPSEVKSLNAARYRVIYEDFFVLQMFTLMLKKETNYQKAFKLLKDVEYNFIKTLPFELTNAQKKVIRDIKVDIGKETPMQRLVQGDVGSGKTVVALYGVYSAFINGYQSAIMVPTEILAKQHYETAKEIFKDIDIKIELLLGSTKKKEKEEIYKKIENNECDLVIGTHALIQDKVKFNKLALAITDEQHRFGVKQRNSLYSKYDISPHILVMTATPIPRTLTFIIQGDLDISIIDELPKGRKEIDTIAFYKGYRNKAYQKCIQELEKKSQVYIVCPLVEESESLDIKSAEELYFELRDNVFVDYNVALLHGKMKAADKSQIMKDFEDKKIDVLISTTVIEVGINVPNATVMVIEDAQRFGLAQLHQLRGRVGRGNNQSYCILLYNGETDTIKQRMKIMQETNNGFVIAEEDLKLRGPGQIFGLKQHGFPDFKMADITKHISIMEKAQRDVREIINQEFLGENEYQELYNRIKEKFEREMQDIAWN